MVGPSGITSAYVSAIAFSEQLSINPLVSVSTSRSHIVKQTCSWSSCSCRFVYKFTKLQIPKPLSTGIDFVFLSATIKHPVISRSSVNLFVETGGADWIFSSEIGSSFVFYVIAVV